MKFLKIYFLALGLIALTNLGLYISTTDLFRFKSVIEMEKWEEILVGKWDFQTKIVSSMETVFFEGEVEYFSDNTFHRLVTYKAFYHYYPFEYEDNYSFEPSETDLVANGSVSGTWKLGDGLYWEESIIRCNMIVNYCGIECLAKYDLDEYKNEKPSISCFRFHPNVTLTFGNYEDKYERITLHKFLKDEILADGVFLHDNSSVSFSFKRKKSRDHEK